MDLKIKTFREVPVFDEKKGYYRAKVATFTVNGAQHTLRISMPDFDAGRATALITAEAKKIAEVYEKTGTGGTSK